MATGNTTKSRPQPRIREISPEKDDELPSDLMSRESIGKLVIDVAIGKEEKKRLREEGVGQTEERYPS